MNPMELMSMLMNGKMPNNLTSNIVNEISKKVIGTMYQEIDADSETKKELFVKDARPSEKIKALNTLVVKSIGNVLNKMKENDINMLYNTLQNFKED